MLWLKTAASMKKWKRKKMSFTRVLGKMTKEQEKLWEVVSKLNLYAPHKET